MLVSVGQGAGGGEGFPAAFRPGECIRKWGG